MGHVGRLVENHLQSPPGQFGVKYPRTPNNQLSSIMAGMIVEVMLPAVYFGVEIANNMENVASPVEIWISRH
jgi:hypothetical protein